MSHALAGLISSHGVGEESMATLQVHIRTVPESEMVVVVVVVECYCFLIIIIVGQTRHTHLLCSYVLSRQNALFAIWISCI